MIANLDKFVARKLAEETITAYFDTFNQHRIRAKPVTMFNGDLCKLDFKSLNIIGQHTKQKMVFIAHFLIQQNLHVCTNKINRSFISVMKSTTYNYVGNIKLKVN